MSVCKVPKIGIKYLTLCTPPSSIQKVQPSDLITPFPSPYPKFSLPLNFNNILAISNLHYPSNDTLAEWLRRQTRILISLDGKDQNPTSVSFVSAGSNPAGVDMYIYFCIFLVHRFCCFRVFGDCDWGRVE